MAMQYPNTAIPDVRIPRAKFPVFQNLLDIYASETNKVVGVWRAFAAENMTFRPHPRSSTTLGIMKHQLLSERRFFGEFLGLAEPPPGEVLPKAQTPEAFAERMGQLAEPRLAQLAEKNEAWWLERVAFFDVTRERVWIFWRRVLHTVHHRTQLSLYLRLLDKPVPPTYGPTADYTWAGADPTRSAEAAGRK